MLQSGVFDETVSAVPDVMRCVFTPERSSVRAGAAITTNFQQRNWMRA